MRDNARTVALTAYLPEERPLAMQLLGEDPDLLAEAARRLEAAGADGIDLNMGCPVAKIVAKGQGAALMRDPLRAGVIFRTLRKAVAGPLTIGSVRSQSVATWANGDEKPLTKTALVIEGGRAGDTSFQFGDKGLQVAPAEWYRRLDSKDVRRFLTPLVLLSLADGEESDGVRMTAKVREKCLAMMNKRFSLKQVFGWLTSDGSVSFHRPDFVHQPSFQAVETMTRLRQLI